MEPGQRIEIDIIGYALGLLEADEAATARAQVDQSEELQAAAADIRRSLAPLDLLKVDSAGRELMGRVLARAASLPKLAAASDAAAPARSGRSRAFDIGGWPRLLRGDEAPASGPVVSLRELLGLAAAVALFVSIFVPAYSRARTHAMQTACLGNLREVGQGEIQYAADYADAFPYAGPASGPWLAPSAGGIPPASNSRHIFLVLQGGYVKPDKFVDPARRGDLPMSSELVRRSADFGPASNSYSTPLLTGPWVTKDCDPAYPLIVDQNAKFEDRRFQPCDDENSNSHGESRGQNVINADGSGAWTTRATVGPGNDDIFSLANISTYTGNERPTSKTDVIVVP